MNYGRWVEETRQQLNDEAIAAKDHEVSEERSKIITELEAENKRLQEALDACQDRAGYALVKLYNVRAALEDK